MRASLGAFLAHPAALRNRRQRPLPRLWRRLSGQARGRSRNSNSTVLFIQFRGAAEFSVCAKRGKENPSLGEGKSKPGEEKSKVCPSANRAFSKSCASPPR